MIPAISPPEQRGDISLRSCFRESVFLSFRSHAVASTSNSQMSKLKRGTVRKAVAEDLAVGLICADRDGNRVRIDRVDREQGKLSYHFLNDELRVQEGVREVPIDAFLAEGWYLG
jgi:hypothetical protein